MGLFDFLRPNKHKGADPFKSSGAIAKLATVLMAGIGGKPDAATCAVFRNGVLANSQFMSLIEPTPFRNGLKLKGSGGKPIRSGEAYLLKVRPNPAMNASEFWQKVAENYYLGVSVVYVERRWDEEGRDAPAAFWPIDLDPQNVDISAPTPDGHVWLRFGLNGKRIDARDDDLLIWSYEPFRELLQKSGDALRPYLRTIGTTVEGLEAAVKASMALRFIILGGGTIGPREQKAASEEMSELLSGASSAVTLDGGSQVVQVADHGKWPLAPEIATVEDKVYQYLGVTPAIMKGDFTEAQWASYFARTIAPFKLKIERELNSKILTKDEYFKGNEWRLGVERLEVITPNTALKRVDLKLKMPLVCTNDLRQDMGEDPIEGGDEILQNLSFGKPGEASMQEVEDGGEGRPSEESQKAGETPDQGNEEA